MPILGAIIVARTDSQRFPGKVLHPLLGRPMLSHVAQRCLQARALEGRVFVATTSRPIDHPIARLAASEGLGVYRGETENVARRLLECAQSAGWDGFFRVNGDSPCLDSALLDQAAEAFEILEPDLVTNLYPRSFPYGISVELLRTSAYAQACRRFDRPDLREHATLFYYENAAEFRIHNIPNPDPDRGGPSLRLTVDTADDVARVESFLASSHPLSPSASRAHAPGQVSQPLSAP